MFVSSLLRKSLAIVGLGAAAVLTAPVSHAAIVTDIVMLVDESGSMGDVQTNLRNNIGTFASILAAGGVDARFALVGYGNSSVSPRLVTDFTTPAGFAAAAAGLGISGGTEPGYSAIAFALNSIDGQASLFNYRTSALKNLILFTDEPSNGDNCGGCQTGGNSTTKADADSLLTVNNALFNAVLRGSGTISSYEDLYLGHGGNLYDLNGLNTTDAATVAAFVDAFARSKLKEIVDFCILNPTDPACTNTVPEPGSLALVGLALAGLALQRRKPRI
jgi:hypothetical protein